MTGADLLGVAATVNNAFLFAFSSLFSIINPVGGALIFDGLTRRFGHADRTRIAAWVGIYSLLIMFGALWTGAYVLSFFGVSLDALRIAGGLVVATSGWRLLTSGDKHADRKSREEQVAEEDAEGDPMQLAFFPLTLPFTTGPGTIAVAITLGAVRPPVHFGLAPFFIGVSLAAVANAAIIWIAYRFADRVTGLIGATARLVVVRLSAFLLMAIGVQILVTAIGDLVMKWRVV
ncbi:MAG TPA: MarC family protein [Roseiarcus sp.]|nr:MarC family protein [Roseiarcus sp.]